MEAFKLIYSYDDARLWGICMYFINLLFVMNGMIILEQIEKDNLIGFFHWDNFNGIICYRVKRERIIFVYC